MHTHCKSIDVGASNRYQCTLPYSPELIYERNVFGLADVGLTSSRLSQIGQRGLIDQVLNRLGNAMAINQTIIAESSDSSAVAAEREALAQQNDSYRRTKRQRSKTGFDGWGRE